MLKLHQVIVMRPVEALTEYPEDFSSLADLQYVCEIHDEHELHWKVLRDKAFQELLEADSETWLFDYDHDYPYRNDDFIVLGVAVDGVYTPWFNRTFP